MSAAATKPSIEEQVKQARDEAAEQLDRERGVTPRPLTPEEIAELRAELDEYRALVAEMRALQHGQPAAQPAVALTPAVAAASSQLEAASAERDAEVVRRAWAKEPKVRIFIFPTEEDKAVRARKIHAGKVRKEDTAKGFPPRRFQVNGVTLWVPVNQYVDVPQSIAELYHQSIQQPYLDTIPAGEDVIGYWVGDNPFGA